MEQLEDRVAVITGGGSGIGEGLARACHQAGMRVVVSDVEEDQAERVANAVRELGGEAIGVRCDVSDAGSVEELAERAYEAYGAVHLLCSNAGVLMDAPLLETPMEDWTWTFGVNLYGGVHCAKTFAPRMRELDGEAHIVFTASAGGVRTIPESTIGVYVSSKYALVGFAETLRNELKADAIGVSVVYPGGVDTNISTATRNRPQHLGGPEPAPPESGLRMTDETLSAYGLISPDEAARLTLEGVRANRLYIFTHPETRPALEDRVRELMADHDAVS